MFVHLINREEHDDTWLKGLFNFALWKIMHIFFIVFVFLIFNLYNFSK